MYVLPFFEEIFTVTEYLERWNSNSLTELCEGLIEGPVTTYLDMIGVDTSLFDYTDE